MDRRGSSYMRIVSDQFRLLMAFNDRHIATVNCFKRRNYRAQRGGQSSILSLLTPCDISSSPRVRRKENPIVQRGAQSHGAAGHGEYKKGKTTHEGKGGSGAYLSPEWSRTDYSRRSRPSEVPAGGRGGVFSKASSHSRRLPTAD